MVTWWSDRMRRSSQQKERQNMLWQHLVCESPKQVDNVNPRFILYPVKKNQKGRGLACNYWFWSYRDSVGLAGLGWFGNHRCFQRQTQFHIQQPKGLGRWPIKAVGHGCSPHMLWEVLSPHSVLESSHPQDRNETFSPFLFVLEFWVW